MTLWHGFVRLLAESWRKRLLRLLQFHLLACAEAKRTKEAGRETASQAKFGTISLRMKRHKLLGINIVRLRREKGVQEGLALEAGLHRTFLAHVERQVRNISIDNIERPANALQVSILSLLLP